MSALPSDPRRRRHAVLLAIALEIVVLVPFSPLPPEDMFGIPTAFALAASTAAAVLVGTLVGVVVALTGAVVFVAIVADFAAGSYAVLGVWPALAAAAGLFAARVTEHRQELEGQVERADDQLRALVDTGIALSSELELGGILQLLVDAAPALAGAECARLELADGSETFVSDGADRVPAGVPDVLVPITLRGTLYGRLRLAGGRVASADEELLGLLATQAAVAIEHARLYEGASRWSRQLESLTETSNALSAEAELAALFGLVAGSLRDLVGAVTTAVLLPTPDGLLRVEAAAGDGAEYLSSLESLGASSRSAHVFESGRPARVDSLLDDVEVDQRIARRLGATAALWTPLVLGGLVLGVLVAFDKNADDRRFGDEDARLAEVFAARAAAAIHVAERAEQEALRKVVAAQEIERQRLAVELHDGTAQALASILLQLRANRSPGLDEVRGLLVETLQSVRRLAVELHPKALDDFGLVAALRRLTDTFREHTGIDVHLEAAIDGERFGPEVETALYRIVQESLSNVEQHSAARSASVLLVRRGPTVSAVVEDDGRGFDPRLRREGYGLDGIRERVRLLGGRVEIESREGAGTTIVAEIPAPLP